MPKEAPQILLGRYRIQPRESSTTTSATWRHGTSRRAIPHLLGHDTSAKFKTPPHSQRHATALLPYWRKTSASKLSLAAVPKAEFVVALDVTEFTQAIVNGAPA